MDQAPSTHPALSLLENLPPRSAKPRVAGLTMVMDKGLIVEEGTHDVLIESKGAYWRLYEAQQRQAESEGAVLRETVIA